MFADDHKIVIAVTTTAGASAATAITSAAIDMAGFNECTFIVPFGPITAGAATSIKVQQCDTTGGTYADLTGTSVTVLDSDDDKVKYVTVIRPQEQFLKLVVSRATQVATVGSVIAILSGSRNRPVTQGTNVAGEQYISPVEGTA